ncbi:MAG TPA: beta-L-arabinofuranosidase domain-containing protein [Acidobacteriaceae bacterium]
MSRSSLSRRHFVTSAAAAAGGLLVAPHSLRALQDAVADVPVSASHTGYEKVEWTWKDFPMTQVRMRGGVLKKALEINRDYLFQLPNDRLAHMFRVTAGQPSSAAPLGGWEAPDCELRGHFAGGHYLSACALMHASTGDDEIRDKGNELVAMLAKCQQSDGYLGAYPTSFYDRLRHFEKVWAPFYTYHKIMAGHLDMYVHAGNEQALRTAERMADWAISYTKGIPDDQWQRMLLVEQGGMAEVSFNLYAVTGKQKYRDLGYRFEHHKMLDPLANDVDDLDHNHANTNIPKIIGAARGYEVAADPRYRHIADNFYRIATQHHVYCTGGTSNGEMWHAANAIASQLGPAAEECCCSYNMMKLARHVYGWTGDPRIFDYYERLMFNVRLGTQDPKGMLMYYVSLKPGYWKTFGTPLDSFWCCYGTGVEEYSKVNDSIYFHDDHNLYVNLFAGSEVDWPEKGVTVIQDTNFPVEEGTTLTIKAQRPARLGLKVRIPYWATKDVAFRINGKPHALHAEPSSYATLDRTWHDGDKVEVRLPMSLHTCVAPDDSTVQAAMFGPLVLAGYMGRDGLTEQKINGPEGPQDDHKTYPMPELATSSGQASDAIRRVRGEEMAFETTSGSSKMQLKPLYRVLDERYTVYWKVNRA